MIKYSSKLSTTCTLNSGFVVLAPGGTSCYAGSGCCSTTCCCCW